MNGDVIFNVMMVMSGIAVAIFVFIYFKGNNKNSGDYNDVKVRNNGQVIDEKNLIDKSKLEDLLGIEEIDENNIIHLKKFNGLRVIFSISTPDIYLLNDDEQHVFENALLNLSLSLNFPVQFLTTTRKIETRRSSEKLLETINSTDGMINENLREYSELLYTQLVAIEQNRKVNEIKNYCIIGVNIPDPKRARSELNARIETIVKGFTNSKIKADLLEKEKILQLLSDMLNRGDNIPLDSFSESNLNSYYTVGQSIGGVPNGLQQ